MQTQRITEGEISELKVASLPSRPTAPAAFGGRGYTATQMKEAFDKLPLFIIERFNSLLGDISADAEDGIAKEIKTGLYEGHTLGRMFSDIKEGQFGNYMTVFGNSLTDHLAALREELDTVEKDMGNAFSGFKTFKLDCGRPVDLFAEQNGGVA